MKTNISKVLKNKRERAAASYIINSTGKGFFIYKGQKFTEPEMDKKFPIEIRKISDKGENPCKKYAY